MERTPPGDCGIFSFRYAAISARPTSGQPRSGTQWRIAARCSRPGDDDLIGRFYVAHGDPGLFVTNQVHRIKGITATKTIIAFDAFTPR
ncbi:hypothetical protein NFI95_08695 [Acetobacteraceae bacterium KSS8]|uniref:Uncharacterized protein n=1 Tax=Endosaccharibacter trunci TaxID=2812733 RepID=A0ABT1W6M4_9PROT|nr:hypothetical protein [Acetobacteraceae bacterium KSS8]